MTNWLFTKIKRNDAETPGFTSEFVKRMLCRLEFKIKSNRQQIWESTNFDAARFNRRWANGTRIVDVVLSNGRTVYRFPLSSCSTDSVSLSLCSKYRMTTMWTGTGTGTSTGTHSTLHHWHYKHRTQNRPALNTIVCIIQQSNVFKQPNGLFLSTVTRLPWLSTNNTNEWAQMRRLYAEASRFGGVFSYKTHYIRTMQMNGIPT